MKQRKVCIGKHLSDSFLQCNSNFTIANSLLMVTHSPLSPDINPMGLLHSFVKHARKCGRLRLHKKYQESQHLRQNQAINGTPTMLHMTNLRLVKREKGS
jgi:hypothetical protein